LYFARFLSVHTGGPPRIKNQEGVHRIKVIRRNQEVSGRTLSKERRCFGCAAATPLEIGRGIDPVVNVCWGCASVAIEMSTMSARRHTDNKRAATPTNRTSSAARAKTVGVIERWKAQLVAGHDLTAGEPATNDESDGRSVPRDRDVHGLSDLGVLISLAILGLACVGGYFLLMKMVEISRQEDCLLGGGRSCARLQLPSNR
jgi:hypothetical protein